MTITKSLVDPHIFIQADKLLTTYVALVKSLSYFLHENNSSVITVDIAVHSLYIPNSQFSVQRPPGEKVLQKLLFLRKRSFTSQVRDKSAMCYQYLKRKDHELTCWSRSCCAQRSRSFRLKNEAYSLIFPYPVHR